MSDPHSVIVCPACDLLIERKLLPCVVTPIVRAVTSISMGAMLFVLPS